MISAQNLIIDSHAHCGVMDTSMLQTFDVYLKEIAGTGIDAAAFFSPVMEIYDRFDYNFVDTPKWQQRRAESNTKLDVWQRLSLWQSWI